ncbi:MAG: GGDEF domain-containing response regulator [Pseudomonadota bacterium]
MKHREKLKLVIVENSASEADIHATTLRNAGFLIQYDLAEDLNSLTERLEMASPDLVLCGESDSLPDPAAVIKLLNQQSCTAPVIAITHDADAKTIISARQAGAMACAPYEPPQGLQLAFAGCKETVDLRHKVELLETALQEAESRSYNLMESSRDAIAYIHEGMHIHANHSYLSIFGLGNVDEIGGMPVLNMIEPGNHMTFKKFLRNYTNGDSDTDQLEIRGMGPDGNSFNAAMEFSHSSIDGENCIQVIIRAAESAELEKKLDILSRQDILTGLANRQDFIRTVNHAISKGFEKDQAHAVTYILIDNFKKTCEGVGMSGGDTLVRHTAKLIENLCGENASIARFGDCAFTVLHRDSDEETTHELAEQLRQAIHDEMTEIDGHAVTMTASIGICVVNEHSKSAENVLSRADLACEVARSSGGNRIHVHSIAVDEQMDIGHEPEWDQVIRKTIDDERFYLVYQPVVSLGDNTEVCYEALLRIVDEQDQVILPGQFIAIAEKNGMIDEIDRWVFKTAVRELAELHARDENATFFIKTSGNSLAKKEFSFWVFNTLKDHGLKSEHIVFEFPESVAVSDLKSTMLFIESMKKIGCRVCVEHFGRHGQLQLIKHLMVDMVKIDGSLISNLAEKKEHQEKVQEIVALVRKTGRQSIAEHVDSPSDLALLWQYEIDFIQGNFVQEPSKELGYNFEEELA